MKKNTENSMYILGGLILGAVLVGTLAFAGMSGTTGNVPSEQKVVAEDAQVVMLGLSRSGYSPAVITVEAGKPVTLKNDGTLGGCGLYPVQPELGINANFANSNEYTFTPTKKGSFTYTCSMGMWKGTINVV